MFLAALLAAQAGSRGGSRCQVTGTVPPPAPPRLSPGAVKAWEPAQGQGLEITGKLQGDRAGPACELAPSPTSAKEKTGTGLAAAGVPVRAVGAGRGCSELRSTPPRTRGCEQDAPKALGDASKAQAGRDPS